MKDRGRTKRRITQEAGKMVWSNGSWVILLMLIIGVVTLGFLLAQLKSMESGELGGFSGTSWIGKLNGGNAAGGENGAESKDGSNAGYYGDGEKCETADHRETTDHRGVLYGTVQSGLPLICVDAGHGYDDPGAMHENLNGLDEKDITLDIALRVTDILVEKGYPVLMTRDSDEIPAWMEQDERGLYVMDPYDRCDIANEAEVDLFISIHCNALPSSPSARGMQLYYTDGHTLDNPEYVEQMADSMEAVFGERPQVIANPENDSYVVNRLVDAPSVLVETGFITNAADARLMLSESWRQQMADALAEGIIRFVEG